MGIVSPLMFMARRPTAFIYALLPGPWAGHPLLVRFSLHPQGFTVSSASGRSHRLRIIALARGRTVSVPLPRLSPYALESICASSWWGDFPHPTGRRPSLLSHEPEGFLPVYLSGWIYKILPAGRSARFAGTGISAWILQNSNRLYSHSKMLKSR